MPFPLLQPLPADPLLFLARIASTDERPSRLDLSVGVYRDAQGATPVLRAVKAAERRLVEEQTTKAYIGIEGDQRFLDLLADLVFGNAGAAHHGIAMQTPGGGGALRLAADLLAAGKPDRTIWVGTPTWSNHLPIFKTTGLRANSFELFDVGSQKLLVDNLFRALETAMPGDAVLLQPLCQNPTGVDLPAAVIPEIAALIAERKLVALIDVAYHGFGESLEADAERIRSLIRLLPNSLVAYSCSKNFGLYRERVGALFGFCESAGLRDLVASNLQALARTNYSMPPDHGAAIVSMILSDERLFSLWREELTHMSRRVRDIRMTLASHGQIGAIDLTPVAEQSGMFSLLPLQTDLIAALRRDHAIYMPDSGRINIAGMSDANVSTFVTALKEVQLQSVTASSHRDSER